MRFSIRKLLLLVFVLAVLGAIAYQVWPKPAPVDAQTIELGAFELTIEADGATRMRDRYLVASPVAGQLARVSLRPGDAVAPQQVLARIAPAPLDSTSLEQAKLAYKSAAARIDQAEAAVRAATTLLELARKKHAEIKELREGNERLASQSQVDQAWAEVEVKEDSLEEAQKALAVVRFDFQRARAAIPRSQWTADLDQVRSLEGASEATPPGGKLIEPESETLVASPLDAPGRVLQVMLQGPATVAPGAPILEIGDASSIEVVVDLLSDDARKVRPGMEVRLKGLGSEIVTGKVDRIDPKAFTKISALGVEEQRVNVFVAFAPTPNGQRHASDAHLDASAAYGDGYAVQATIVLSRREKAVLAPVSAVFHQEGGPRVYAIENERAVLRSIESSQRNDDFALVTSGLKPGDVVVERPGDSLHDGDWVKPLLSKRSPSHTAAAEEEATASAATISRRGE